MSFNPYLEVIISALLFGMGGILVKIIALPATTISFFRVAIPVLLLLIYFRFHKLNIFRKSSKAIIFISFLNALRIFLWQFAYLHTSIGNAVIILYTWPIFTVLFGPILIKEKLTRRNLILVLIAFIGIVIIFSNKNFSLQNKDFLGMISMLGAAVLGAITTILLKSQLKHYSKTETIFYQNIAGAVLFLPFIFINFPLPTISQTIIACVYASLIGLFAFLFWFSALKKINASTLAIISYIEVVSAVVLGIIILHEKLSWNMIVGGGIILIVSYFARKTDSQLVTE